MTGKKVVSLSVGFTLISSSTAEWKRKPPEKPQKNLKFRK